MSDTCDYGGCEGPVYGGINHEGEHNFCEYHYRTLNP